MDAEADRTWLPRSPRWGAREVQEERTNGWAARFEVFVGEKVAGCFMLEGFSRSFGIGFVLLEVGPTSDFGS